MATLANVCMVCDCKLKGGHMVWCSPECYNVFRRWRDLPSGESRPELHRFFLMQPEATAAKNNPTAVEVYHGGR